MTDYTKDQEHKALEDVGRFVVDEHWARGRHATVTNPDAIRIVLAMAKRTKAAEAAARRCDGHVAREAALEAELNALKAHVSELEKERAEVVEKCCFASDEERQSVLGGISLADHIRRRIDNLAGQRDKAEETNRNNLRVSSDLLDSKIKQMEYMDQDLQAARRERDAFKTLSEKTVEAGTTLRMEVETLKREREALNTRVAELEKSLDECDRLRVAAETRVEELLRTEEANARWKEHNDEALARIRKDFPKPPTVAPTREVWEALSEFAQTWTHWIGREQRPAARLVVAIRKMLEVGK